MADCRVADCPEASPYKIILHYALCIMHFALRILHYAFFILNTAAVRQGRYSRMPVWPLTVTVSYCW